MNERVLCELMDAYNYCSELFHIAYKLNGDEDTRTAFSQKTTTYMPHVLQTLSFIIDNDSVYMTKEEYDKLLEYKYMYENLCH